MPWDKTERAKFCRAAETRQTSMSELCELYGISEKTAYKWLARWREGGEAALADHSRRPSSNSRAIDEITAERLIALRIKHPRWGARKLLAWLAAHSEDEDDREWPAASTVTELLKRRGLVRHRGRRQRSPMPRTQPLEHASHPNALWAMDFKGDFRLGDGARCYPLTVTDQCSRMLLCCKALPTTKGEPVRRALEATFREWGLPDFMRSDNGPPFGARRTGPISKLGVWLVKVGVMPEYIDLGKPQQNGRQERFHGTLGPETVSPPAHSLRAQQHRFDAFLDVYNDERPHEAIGMVPPGMMHHRSPRDFPRRVRSPEYSTPRDVRLVNGRGFIHFQSERLYIGEPLAGEPVAVTLTNERRWDVWFGPLIIAHVHLTYPELGGRHKRRGRLTVEPRPPG